MKEVFDLAFYRCQRRLWIWKRMPYDEEGEAISKLVIEEIKREMWYDIRNGLPNQEKIRKIVMQGVYKAVTAIVTPVVSTGWAAAQEATDPVKQAAKEILGDAFDQLVEVEETIKEKLTEGIKRGLEPVMEALSPILSGLTEALSEPLVRVFGESSDDINRIKQALNDAVQSGEEAKCEEIKIVVQQIKEDKYQRINELLQEKLESVIGDLSSHVSIQDLSELFGPLRSLINIVESAFNLVLNPEHQVYCLKTLCEHRRIIESLDISKDGALVELERLLDNEESWVLWRRWWTWYYYNCEAWSLYYNLWRLDGIGSAIYPIRKASLKYAKIHYKYDKKFSFKFGDYLHKMAKDATPENWKTTVEDCFMIGYKKANQMALKESKKIGHRLVVDFIYESVAGKIEKMIVGGMKEIITPLESLIPNPINKLLDLNSIVAESVQKALRGAVEELVTENIINPFVAQICGLDLDTTKYSEI